MKLKNIFISSLLLASFSATAQKAVDSAVNKIKTDQQLSAINKVNDKVSDKVSQGIDKMFDHPFRKKNRSGQGNVVDSSTNTFVTGPGKSLITINNTDYKTFSLFTDVIKSNTQVKEVVKEFSNGTGRLKVIHNGTADQLLDELIKSSGERLEVIDVTNGKIYLKAR